MYGLVLEGGGTKGAYHIGAYKALMELGIPIKCIVGSSIGAVNGAIFAQGDWEQADELWDNISASDVISLSARAHNTQNLLDIKNLQTLIKEIQTKKGLDISPFEKLLRHMVDEEKLRRSHIDFGLATFNVTGVKEQQMFIRDIPEGELVDYLVASARLPGFQPKKIGNSVYMDGGVTNNMPVDMLVKAGYTDIICVEVGGIGFLKKINGAGCNIISVKSGNGSVGTLDFSGESILEAKMLGYLDTLRAMGVLTGDKYYISSSDYYASRIRYSDKLITELQRAAEIFGIDKYKVYTIDELAGLVLNEYNNTQIFDIKTVIKKPDREKTAALADAMINSNSEILENSLVAGVLGAIFEAASAVAYFYKTSLKGKAQ